MKAKLKPLTILAALSFSITLIFGGYLVVKFLYAPLISTELASTLTTPGALHDLVESRYMHIRSLSPYAIGLIMISMILVHMNTKRKEQVSVQFNPEDRKVVVHNINGTESIEEEVISATLTDEFLMIKTVSAVSLFPLISLSGFVIGSGVPFKNRKRLLSRSMHSTIIKTIMIVLIVYSIFYIIKIKF